MHEEILICLSGYTGRLFRPRKSYDDERDLIKLIGFYVEGSFHPAEIEMLNRLGNIGFLVHKLKELVNEQRLQYFKSVSFSYRKAICDGIEDILGKYKHTLEELESTIQSLSKVSLALIISKVSKVIKLNS